MKISLNQINTVSGDIKGNFENILKRTKTEFNENCDIVVFPETAFTGYCVGALWDNTDFIFEQENCVRELMKIVPYNKCVIVGYVSYHGTKPDGFPKLKNSVAVINKNSIKRYDKQLLANADHHEDRKYFYPGKKSKVFKLFIGNEEVIVGIPICEDAWYINHNRNIPKEMVELGANLLISINQSYFYYNKQDARIKLFSKLSSDLKKPIITVNSVGVGDIVKNIIIFDGSSMVFDGGEKVIQMKRFEEDCVNFHYYTQENSKLNTVYGNYDSKCYCSLDADIEPDIRKNAKSKNQNKFDEIIDALCFEQKELFKLLGISKAQVHISGGLDSAVVMALSILSMGKENCVFITNPTSLNSDSLPMVKQLSENFGVEIHTNDLEDIYQVFKEKDTLNFGSELNPTGQATIQAVLRTVQGLASCHRFNSGIVATGNHTEIVLGWASFHDIGSIGVHAPIGDLTKLELFELCVHINKRFQSLGFIEQVIPEDLFNGRIRPAAELPDSKYDPIDYYIQSGLCAEIIRNRKTKTQLISNFENKKLTPDFFPKDIYEKYSIENFTSEVDFTLRKSRISVFKAAQGAPIVILSPRSRGFSNRETIINKYR